MRGASREAQKADDEGGKAQPPEKTGSLFGVHASIIPGGGRFAKVRGKVCHCTEKGESGECMHETGAKCIG